MKVEYRRSGGLSGLSRGCELDTEKMPPREAKKLVSLLRECEGAAAGPPPAEARDTLLHEILMEEDDGTRHTFVFDELDLPPSAAPLLEFLEERSGSREP